MLGAGAEPADEQRGHQHGEAGAGAGQAIAEAGERGAEREHRGGAQPFGHQACRNLEARHGAGEQAAQQPELGIAEPELPLPDRQQDVDEIGVAVVQRVRPAGDGGGAPLVALGGEPGGILLEQIFAGRAHDADASKSSQ